MLLVVPAFYSLSCLRLGTAPETGTATVESLWVCCLYSESKLVVDESRRTVRIPPLPFRIDSARPTSTGHVLEEGGDSFIVPLQLLTR
jgi:hypothetical protein